MCGRYNIKTTGAEIADELGALWEGQYTASFNVAPTTEQPVILFDESDQRVMRLFRWGLVPFWAKDPKIGARMINARSETVAEKPAFRAAYKRRRCIVPASGYYEWKTDENGKKQPFNIIPSGQRLFTFAGLWEQWEDSEGKALRSYTILTCAADEHMKQLHHRVPVMLAPGDIDLWLTINDDDNTQGLDKLLAPFPAENIEFFPVPKAVGNVRNNTEILTQPIVREDDDRNVEAQATLGFE